ncbi:hypothetical protein KAU08_11675 [bacterium]|nr:hypothetical protein [bacterium]
MANKIVKKNKRNRINVRNQRGSTFVIFVISLVALLGSAGLVIDYGRGVWVKTRLQRAADAAALAGASVLPDYNMAQVKAESVLYGNFPDPDDVTFAISGNNYKIIISENVDTLLMRVLGYNSIDVTASAMASGPESVGGMNGGVFPFAIINPDVNSDPADDLTPWNFGNPYIIGYGETNTMVEDWANGSDPCPSHPGGGGGNSNSHGWRAALDLNPDGTLDGNGANALRTNIELGWPGQMEINDLIPMEYGNMAGPISQGRSARLGSNPMPWDDFDVETSTHSPRVVLVAIVHLINENRGDAYTIQDYNNGATWNNQDVVVDGFAPFFMLTEDEHEQYVPNHGMSGDWVVGYYIPGTDTSHFLDSDGWEPDYGLYTTPRLIE